MTAVADGAGYMLLIITVVFFAWLFLSGGWTPEERKRLYVIGLFFLAAALFWSLFEQAGSTLNLFADRDTRTSSLRLELPEQLVPVDELDVHRIARAGLCLALDRARLARALDPGQVLVRPALRRRRLRGAGAWPRSSPRQGVQVSPLWLTVVYLLHTCGELCLSPGRLERDDQARAGAYLPA